MRVERGPDRGCPPGFCIAAESQRPEEVLGRWALGPQPGHSHSVTCFLLPCPFRKRRPRDSVVISEGYPIFTIGFQTAWRLHPLLVLGRQAQGEQIHSEFALSWLRTLRQTVLKTNHCPACSEAESAAQCRPTLCSMPILPPFLPSGSSFTVLHTLCIAQGQYRHFAKRVCCRD